MTVLLARALLVVCAALAGAAGMAIEVTLVRSAGLALGYGRSAAVAPALWISGWALGAWLAGRSRLPLVRALAVVAVVGVVLPVLGGRLLLGPGASSAQLGLATALGWLVPAVVALPQGAFAPLLARAWSPGGARGVGWLFCASFAGGVPGALWWADACAGQAGLELSLAISGASAALAAALAACVCLATTDDAAKAGADPGQAYRGADPLGKEGRATLPMTRAMLVVGLVTAWTIVASWVVLRLGTLWLGGMQPALSAVLSANLAALSVGALLLPRLVPAGIQGVRVVIALCAVGGLWALVSPALLSDLGAGRAVRALVLGGPMLVSFGAIVPCLYRATGGEGGRRLGDLLLGESLGAAIGAPLAHALLVPAFGLAGALGVATISCGLTALVLLDLREPRALSCVAAALICGVLLALAPEPALRSPQLTNPALQVHAFYEDSSFAVSVVDDGVRGERTLLTDEFRATGTGDDYLYMRVLGHLPVLLHPDPRTVAVLAFGTGTTAGSVSLHPEVERIEVLELSRAVIDFAGWFEDVNHGVCSEGLPGLLDEGDGQARVVVRLGDGRRTLRGTPGRYDVLTMEPLLPDSPFAVYLYTREFYSVARAALAEGGLVCQWVPPHALEPRTFEAVVDSFTGAFPWSGLFLFGSQLVLVGADEVPALDPSRFPSPGAAPELEAELMRLGLARPEGLLARWVCGGGSWGPVERELLDMDPWIVYARRDRGAAVLGDLARNMASMRRVEEDPPAEWAVGAGIEAWERLEVVRLVRRAREAHEREEALRARVQLPVDSSLPAVDELVERLRERERGAAADPEWVVLERRIRFDQARTGGVLALGARRDREAFDLLTLAASLRPGRADVHLFVAIAALRLGQAQVARAAAQEALERCPRLLETPQGEAALRLGGAQLLEVMPG